MRLNNFLIILFIYSFVQISGSVDLTQKLPFTSGGELYMTNNPLSQDPSYSELISFLQNDTTDTIPYTSTFKCGEFATLLHNNAESQGIRSSIVDINFQNESVGHAVNAFNTTDKGLIFIDCTSCGNPSDDKIAILELNTLYDCTSIFDPENTTVTYTVFNTGSQSFNLPKIQNTGTSYYFNHTVESYSLIW